MIVIWNRYRKLYILPVSPLHLMAQLEKFPENLKGSIENLLIKRYVIRIKDRLEKKSQEQIKEVIGKIKDNFIQLEQWTRNWVKMVNVGTL